MSFEMLSANITKLGNSSHLQQSIFPLGRLFTDFCYVLNDNYATSKHYLFTFYIQNLKLLLVSTESYRTSSGYILKNNNAEKGLNDLLELNKLTSFLIIYRF